MLILTAANANFDPNCKLTRREREVVRLIAEGLRNKQIAHAMNCSVKTVESHRGTAMRRAGLKSTVDIVRYAVRAGLAHI